MIKFIFILPSIFAYIFLTIGFILSSIGIIGLYRFNDIYQKQHAISIVETTGIGFIIVGLCFLSGLTFITLKLILFLLLLFFINNSITTLFLRSAYFSKIAPLVKNNPSKKVNN